MPICCICGKEANYLHHGLWWCKSHKPVSDENSTEKHRSIPKKKKESKKLLGLKWI